MSEKAAFRIDSMCVLCIRSNISSVNIFTPHIFPSSMLEFFLNILKWITIKDTQISCKTIFRIKKIKHNTIRLR